MENSSFIFKEIEDKIIVWFEKSNEYLILEKLTSEIIIRLSQNNSVNDVALFLSEKLDAPEEKAIDFVLDIKKQFFNIENEPEIINDYRDTKIPDKFEVIRYYKVNSQIFKVSFLSEKELFYIHPKISHLEISETQANHHFQVFINHNYIFLYVNDNFIGSWSRNDVHYFQGKFSMEFIQKIHQKGEDKWLGIFHASALSNGKKSILFLGDSGNGKSTSLALLQNAGYTCLADDFVPMDADKQEVYAFPAGISIKKNSLETLLPIYPELETSAEYNFTRLNKIVRFLKPNNNNYEAHLPCRDIVFIKYQKDSELIFKNISKIEAFQQLVPDSWLSPLQENASTFLEWFSGLNCYELKYSNNKEMIDQVSKLFKT